MLSLQLLVALLVLVLPALRTTEGAPTKWINSVAGPWIVYIEKVVICPDSDMDKSWGYADGYVRISHWNPHRPRDLQIVNGNATLVNASVSDDKWFRITLDVRSNNMWKENAFVVKAPGGGCSFVRTNIPKMWHAFTGKDPKEGGRCYVGEGTYVWKDVAMDWYVPNVPIMPYGYYRAIIHGGMHGREHLKPGLCIKAEVHIVPKV